MKRIFLSLLLALSSLSPLPLRAAQPEAVKSSALDCATLVYALPGVRFMQKLRPAKGAARVAEVRNLPEGLGWNARRSLVEGYVTEPGTYRYLAVVEEEDGRRTEEPVTLVCSAELPQPTPFMGLLTWNAFENTISADKVYAIADAMVEYGLRDAGYTYLCLDDQWAERERNAEGRLACSREKFPQGFHVLADYVHARGMKFGIYSNGGTRTCSDAQPGSWQHEDVDAKDFVDWGFDLLKYDYCFNPGTSAEMAQEVYRAMGQALAKHAPKRFLYYICEWGHRNPWEWGAEVGGSCWRATDDTRDSWVNPKYKGGVMENLEIFKRIWPYNGVNRWNDADMLMCGLHGQGKSSNAGTDGRGMTMDEYRTQFALWCMWSSPLTLAFDITALGGKPGVSGVQNPYYAEDLALITNKHLIALNQDRLGQSAEPIYDTAEHVVFMKDLENGDVALSVTNLDSASTQRVTLDLADFPAFDESATYRPLNCWTGEQLGGRYSTKKSLVVEVAPHATEVYRFLRQRKMPKARLR